MDNKNCLGIWMDHSVANLMVYNNLSSEHKIESEFTHHTKMEALHQSESGMHQKEQQLLEAYYKEIGEEIIKYDKVLLFGPTDAKNELHNFLLKDRHFNEIEFDILNADKMTKNEKIAFVENHFI